MNLKIGQGIDFHRLENGLSLWIGGILIPSEKGCVAHSDGDVLLHAVCDALLGAAGLKDIGHYFPDTSEEFRNIDSKILLGKTFGYIREKGFRIVNIDSTILLEKPKIYPYIDDMKSVISSILDIQPDNISIKATTTEKMGPVGREEGITATAVVLLEKD
ncbi:MAG TPA: 2-C-methyl-D-erythritol 2,4-cyclodiphosphate synthase [Bacteroidales bacterium]|jgi:2-C-methyl-D-erythritol 2,4-cyclodiphosphate synthase|nr:2-C-methyl-D-erythritol 2,4-cyclodiphosphate synthase [Bacteroidales bacterium]OQB60921.1 MAG: 2-C-methyl-D-erythritol 2,4-cyclodiphosphate synthase [Bacteroidetes bacterium ADurb.Bin145]HOU02388.1 2-C-methyl-D-erythritol 2,4-cyclodiphosphate synthase [Bacteroidales bacterium]HQG63129.1 2-C-methyl-D-erythritol 2,4-cyclodiphosphate synthase [Bacteroidales bacterium]HQK68726.1 2-C-methyl-D-erythritol 2,4-cyclodiphosphate synthase [Bacteroidales bacterium]